MSIEQFVRDPTQYATTGSGRGLPRLVAPARYWDVQERRLVEGEFRLPSSKWAGFLASTPADLEREMLAWKKQYNRMFIKPDETAKIRTIITGDVATSLKMGYLDYFVQAALHDCELLPITWGDSNRLRELQRFARSTSNAHFVHMPVDQSSFDTNVSLDLVLTIVEWLVRVAVDFGGGSEAARVGEALLFALDGGTLETADGEKFEIERGVLSGWKWTALLDSLANYVQFTEVSEFMGVEAKTVLFQGDDVMLELTSYSDAVLIYEGYKAYGVVVNPAKFWISRTRDEFLRLVSDEGEVRGYPARSVTGLLYLRPGSSPPAAIQALEEQVSGWERLISRGAVQSRVRRLQIQEIVRVLAVDHDVAEQLLHTPKAVGGYGVWPYADRWMAITVPVAMRTRFVGVGNVKLGKVDAEMLTTILGAQLPAPPARARAYRLREVRVPVLRLQSLSPWDPVVYTSFKLPGLRWDEASGMERMRLTEELVAARVLPEIPQLLNLSWVWAMRSYMGKTAWVDWVKGSLTPTPVMQVNPVVVSRIAAAVAGINFRRLLRCDYHAWRVAVELQVASVVSESALSRIGY
jgi:hypothetical protein